ncbi:MAG: ABC transporter ATP-binding protein [Alphaproteobacteria bacterium]|nr:ABC transporter ATP-binding protein [Alphaproteobacteria bacterium]
MTALVAIAGLSVALPPGGDRPYAVRDVSLEIGTSEIVCIVGESGSGKSVTAHALMGLLPRGLDAAGGSIRFDGREILGQPAQDWRRMRGAEIAMIFQDPMAALNPVVPVGRQITEQIRAHRSIGEAAAMQQAGDLMVQMGLEAAHLHAFPHQLSGGQRQRVMIAMALSLSPRLLIADEPTTALDVTTQAQILDLIRTVQKERQMSVLFITHDFGVVSDLADRVAVMRAGEVVESGPVRQVLDDPRHPYTRALIAAVPRLSGSPDPLPPHAPVLAVTGLSKVYRRGGGFLGLGARRETRALDKVSLTLQRGETLGIVGESGSGKSTLARCIIRLADVDDGEILFDGADLAKMNGRGLRACRKRIQMVFQDPFSSLNPRHTVSEIVTAGPRAHGEGAKEALARAAEMLALVGLEASALPRYPHEFSGGQRQRIGLARALMLKPDVLIADEPVSALDVTVQAQVLELLDRVRAHMNLAMLFITHDMRVAARICHRVMVMRQGRVVEEGPAATLFAAPKSDYTSQLLAAIPGQSRLEA